MGLVLGQSLIFIPTTGILKYLPFKMHYGCPLLLFTRKLRCLKTCDSVVYVVMMGLVLGQSLMVISTTDILLYAKVSPLYNVLWECIVVVYT